MADVSLQNIYFLSVFFIATIFFLLFVMLKTRNWIFGSSESLKIPISIVNNEKSGSIFALILKCPFEFVRIFKKYQIK